MPVMGCLRNLVLYLAGGQTGVAGGSVSLAVVNRDERYSKISRVCGGL